MENWHILSTILIVCFIFLLAFRYFTWQPVRLRPNLLVLLTSSYATVVVIAQDGAYQRMLDNGWFWVLGIALTGGILGYLRGLRFSLRYNELDDQVECRRSPFLLLLWCSASLVQLGFVGWQLIGRRPLSSLLAAEVVLGAGCAIIGATLALFYRTAGLLATRRLFG